MKLRTNFEALARTMARSDFKGLESPMELDGDLKNAMLGVALWYLKDKEPEADAAAMGLFALTYGKELETLLLDWEAITFGLDRLVSED